MIARLMVWSVVVASAMLSTMAAAGPPASAQGGQRSEAELYMGGFEGTWVGKLRSVDGAAIDSKVGTGKAGDLFEIALVVAGGAVRVLYRDKAGKWSEVKPGAFRIAAHKTNATVFATDSASDIYDKTGSGGWVESWTFTLSHKDRDTLYAGFTRAVNNYLEDAAKENARFFSVRFGELRKVPALP